MINRVYTVTVDLTQSNQGVSISGFALAQRQLVATTFLTGRQGDPGDQGVPGAGVPLAGTTNQALVKTSSTDYATQWSTIDKTFVGLGSVDNTSDANKPVSTATQTALNAKQNTVSLTTAGTSGAATFNPGTGALNIPNYASGGGSGTVTSVSVTTANGVSGSVATSTTTPAISLSLGAITPTSVNGTTSTEIGYLSGATSSVQTQLNGKQATGNYITALTGDVTASGPGSAAATLATVNSNVGSFTNANITVDGKGRITAASNGSGGGGGSGITRSVVNTSGSYSLGSTALTDYVYLVTGAHAGTLPTASGNTNRYTVKNNHTAAITVTRAGSDLIEGVTSITIAPSDSVDLISNGTAAWSVI